MEFGASSFLTAGTEYCVSVIERGLKPAIKADVSRTMALVVRSFHLLRREVYLSGVGARARNRTKAVSIFLTCSANFCSRSKESPLSPKRAISFVTNFNASSRSTRATTPTALNSAIPPAATITFTA
ncbi:MAG: hypothetical protein OEX06_00375 [Candidatus Bathyarchaeota archaeon]|nr:hypothetical protein [Candidatus Bathyarchaeota archaeon]MDH5701203.1 hypothetical protein [Candidatus Bathyarchaeota archaeon]